MKFRERERVSGFTCCLKISTSDWNLTREGGGTGLSLSLSLGQYCSFLFYMLIVSCSLVSQFSFQYSPFLPRCITKNLSSYSWYFPFIKFPCTHNHCLFVCLSVCLSLCKYLCLYLFFTCISHEQLFSLFLPLSHVYSTNTQNLSFLAVLPFHRE